MERNGGKVGDIVIGWMRTGATWLYSQGIIIEIVSWEHTSTKTPFVLWRDLSISKVQWGEIYPKDSAQLDIGDLDGPPEQQWNQRRAKV